MNNSSSTGKTGNTGNHGRGQGLPAPVRRQLQLVSYQDKRKISQAFRTAGAIKDEAERGKALTACMQQLQEAVQRLEARKAAVPAITYNEDLPVSQKRAEIIKTIRENQVVIIAGETGSGKTTQIPKMCLEAGLGVKGFIGHTQPRRIAARAVASRIAEELHEPLGQSVGFKVRFTDVTSENSYIKLMTDGILLAETSSDRLLLNYDCIIIDEAHERSLNIDFLLGYIKRILKMRPELKLIITSATIDPERFSEHFDHAPIIEVSGRTYPVELVYMPLYGEKSDPDADSDEDDDGSEVSEMDLRQGVLKALHFLQQQGRGDVLVFLPGERDIMDMAAFLKRSHLPGTEILPLYARLATAEQNKIFAPHTGVRVVLSTNVAETSLTVPGIKYVIDPGTARISRYSPRTKVQHLPVEPISQASANQRKGRCGRVSNGICVRLYSEDDFNSRPLYTDPEILRTNLAAVILQMVSLHLGDITDFPFIDAPSPRQISDGLRLLEELGAIKQSSNRKDTSKQVLTKIGQDLSRIPADPRLARMLIEGGRMSSLNEVLIITSALAVMDPRERPLDKQQAADQQHQRFKDDKSDFLSFVKLYDYVTSLQKELSNSALRRRLKQEFISYLRVREWFDVYRQLKASCKTLDLKFNQLPADYEAIHRALLSGLLSQAGQLEANGNEYKGARGIKFLIFPGSALAKKPPKWVCAAVLSETSRLFARTVAAIDPLWLEQAGAHLIRKTYNEPHWSKKAGAVQAYLTISLYGLTIVQGRLVQYTDIDPKLCRELLIRDGLVAGNMDCRHKFFLQNQSMLDDVAYLEDKIRRRDLLVDPQTLEHFYDERIPQSITTQRHFDKWWREKQKTEPHFLDFSYELISRNGELPSEQALYPEYWQAGQYKLKLTYVFDPSKEDDGVSVHIPVTILNQINADDFTWQIPGLQDELFTELIRSLPKRLRRNLIPAPTYARALSESLSSHEGNLYVKAAKELTRMGGEIVSPEDFDLTTIDKHLFMNFVIEDLSGATLSSGKNFKALAAALDGKAREALQQVVHEHKSRKKPAAVWTFGEIKHEHVTKQGSLEINAYPALTDKGSGVVLELYDSKEKQLRAMWLGQRKLLSLAVKNPAAYLEAHLPNKAKLSMYYQPIGTVKELIDDMILAAIDSIMRKYKAPVWNEIDYRQLADHVRADLNDEVLQVAKVTEQILSKAHELKRLLKGSITFELARTYADVEQQLSHLVYKGFVSQSRRENLLDIPRYLQAAIERLKKAGRDVTRDVMYLRKIEEVQKAWQDLGLSYPKDNWPEDLLQVKWMIEELRVSYYAQTLGVKGPVSDRRILNELQRIRKDYPPLR